MKEKATERSKKFLKKIKDLRKKSSLHQSEMAKKLGMQLSGYGKIERGYSHVSLEKLLQMLEIFGVSAGEFFKEEPLGVDPVIGLEFDNHRLRMENGRLQADKEYLEKKLSLSEQEALHQESKIEKLQKIIDRQQAKLASLSKGR